MNPTQTETQPHRVTILAFEGSMEMSISMARDLFYAAVLAEQGERPNTPNPNMPKKASEWVQVATQDGERVRTFSGSWFEPDCSIAEVKESDLIIVSGIWRDIDSLLSEQRPTMEWLVEQYERGAILSCLHTAPFLVAEAGLLDDKVATIYWRMIDEFKARYPKVILQPEKNITSSGRIFCSSGVTSGVESGIYLIEKIWGMHVAARVAQHFLMDIPKGQDEFLIAFEQQKQHKDERIHIAQQWLESNFSSEFLLEEVADKIGLSLRSFRRRFKEATGDTPMQYLQKVRIENAKELLASSTLGVDQISYRVGYDDASYFSRLFKQKMKMTPGDYRASRSNTT